MCCKRAPLLACRWPPEKTVPLRFDTDDGKVMPFCLTSARHRKIGKNSVLYIISNVVFTRSTWVDGASYYGDATSSCYVNIYHICQTTDCYSWYSLLLDQSRYQQLVYIAITTLQIRRLLLDDVESANVCIVRCSIYSCAPVFTY